VVIVGAVGELVLVVEVEEVALVLVKVKVLVREEDLVEMDS